MGLTLITEPDHLNLSDNTIKVAVETDNYLINAGTNCQFKLVVTGGSSTPGEKLSFLFDGIFVEMESATVPDDSGLQFPLIGVMTDAQYTDALRIAFNKNYLLNLYYTIHIFTNEVYFTSKAENKYKATNFNALFSSDIPDIAKTVVTAGTDNTYEPNFFIGFDIYVETVRNSGNYTKLPTIYSVPGTDQIAYTNIHERLQSFVQNEFLPDITSYEICSENSKRFYFKYFEFYGETPTAKLVYTSDTYFVLKGGLRHIGYNRDEYDSFWDFYEDTKIFLTWKKLRHVDVAEKQWLYWFNNYTRLAVGMGFERIRLKARLHFTDNTTQTVTQIQDTTSVNDDLVCFPAGFTQLDLVNVDITKTIRKYELWLEAELGTIITEEISFIVEEEDYLNKYFLYENCLGGFETLRTTGRHEFGIESYKDEARMAIPLEAERSTLNREIHQLNKRYRMDNKGRTGGIATLSEMIVLIEFLISEQYIAIDRDGIQYPVVVGFGKKPIYEDDNHLWGIDFDYQEANINTGYSNH